MAEQAKAAEFKRRGELQSTGYQGSTFTKDRMAIGPCDHVDPALVAVFTDAVQLLYAAVSAARTLPKASDPKRNAMRQILVASAAVAATEAEALVTLCSFDLCAPARIHARALGDIARRFLLLPNHPDVALKMFESLEASRKELLRKIPEDHPARKAMEPLFADADSDTMQKIEHRAYEGDDQNAGILMGPYESKMLSKWNHADIVALADAGDRLLAAGERVRTTLVLDSDADLVLHRGLGKVLAILFVMVELFAVNIREQVDELVQRHAVFVERFRSEGEALKKRMAAATSQR
jgi:hypothetical protein